jgi:capsular exopolysaccharide synthesis family protein
VDLRSGLRLLRERWKLITLVTVLAVAASGFFTWRETPLYSSQVTMFVSARGSAEDTAAAYQGSLLSQQKVKSYAELMRGRRVMAGVVERLDLDTAPKQLAGKVSTAAIPDTSLLTVTVHDPSPEHARRVADAVSKEFIELVPELERVGGGGPPAVKVTVVSPAELPVAPVSPKPVRNLALAAMLGLLVGFGLAVARRALDTTVKSVEQTEELSGAASLGTVLFDSGAAKRPLINPATHLARAEAFRKVRTNLQFMDVDRPHQAILVTSAVPGEGKSVTACNLAIALAEAQQRVILVDADLRRPSVARYLGLPNGVGLTTVLLGKARLEDATQSWGGQFFHVLASGPAPPNPTTLLASVRLRSLLEELRGGYDVVIVDSPPALPVADAAALAAACDGVAVVVRHGKTRHDQLRTTVRALQGSGVPILGTILNQAPYQRGSYYAYDYRQPGHEHRAHGDLIPTPAGGPAEPAPAAPPVPLGAVAADQIAGR